MPSVAVVYAAGSKAIRRVIVSEKDALALAALVPGEDVVEVPFQTYSEAGHAELADYLAQTIGPPTKDTRCVEVDPSGKVLAVYAADPDIDKPLLGKFNTLELNTFAKVGAQKVNGVLKAELAQPIDEVGIGANE